MSKKLIEMHKCLSIINYSPIIVLNIILFCLQVYNLGTGRGYSVLEMVKAVEKASGKTVSKGTHGSPEALATG